MNAEKYSAPDTYDPKIIFGFGRRCRWRFLCDLIAVINLCDRICAGKNLAETTLFLAIAMVVATFNIGREKDSNGQEILPEVEYTKGVISYV